MTQLVDALLMAAKHDETPGKLSLLLSEAALCIMRIETRDLYDQKRLEWLEELGSFVIDKKDGQDPQMLLEMCGGQFFTAQAPTVREAVDLAFAECKGLDVDGFYRYGGTDE